MTVTACGEQPKSLYKNNNIVLDYLLPDYLKQKSQTCFSFSLFFFVLFSIC